MKLQKLVEAEKKICITGDEIGSPNHRRYSLRPSPLPNLENCCNYFKYLSHIGCERATDGMLSGISVAVCSRWATGG